MAPRPEREVSVRLQASTVSTPLDDVISIDCTGCAQSLDLHQPDAALPNRMLGTCEACQAWYLIEFSSEGTSAVILRLPTAGVLHELLTTPG